MTRGRRLAWLAAPCLALALALALSGGACGKPDSTRAGDPRAASGDAASIRATLCARAGDQTVHFAATERGLVAATATGVLDVLVPGAVTRGHHSAADGLLFFVRDQRLEVLDLRRATPAPIALLGPVPEAARIDIRLEGQPTLTIGRDQDNIHVALDWSASPSVRGGADIEDLAEPGDLAAVSSVTLERAGADWLASQLDRSRDATVPARSRPHKLEALAGESFADCDGCLDALDFGGSGWQIFVSESSCGDFCYRGCALYDPRTGQVAPVEPRPAWTAPDDLPESGPCRVQFDATGKTYAAAGDSRVCTVGADCRDAGGPVLGFLDSGASIDL